MTDYRFFYKRDSEKENGNRSFRHAGQNRGEKNHVAMFSDFFGSVGENMFCTNAMYADFKDAVMASIGICGTRDPIVLDIYESTASNEQMREMLQIGFRRYIHTGYRRRRQEHLSQLVQVSFLAILGILLILLVRGLGAGWNLPSGVIFLLENVGAVLLWQFVGYWAFEYAGQKRELERLKQIEALEYTFRTWE